MRSTTKATLNHYLDGLDISGDVLEIGAFTVNKSAAPVFPAPRFRYRDCDISVGNIPDTIVADITDCREQIGDESFDVVLSCDVFEHIDRPWLAAAEIARILRPGGIALTRTLWSWRNHPCPIDYWRYSPECLEFLFKPLDCLEKGYDLVERRVDYPGFWQDGRDSVPVDGMGGFRENWAVYSVHRKGSGKDIPQFKHTDHPMAAHLRVDTQGRVTNPDMLGVAGPINPSRVDGALTAMNKRIDRLTVAIENGGRSRHRRSASGLKHEVAARAPWAASRYRTLRSNVSKFVG